MSHGAYAYLWNEMHKPLILFGYLRCQGKRDNIVNMGLIGG